MVTGEHGLDLSAGGSSMTLFVPTDAAFQELGAGTVESALKKSSSPQYGKLNNYVKTLVSKSTARW